MMQSVAAFIFCRYNHRNHFPLNSCQGSFAVHQLSIQVIVLPHGAAVDTVYPEDIVLVWDPVFRRNRFFSYVFDMCHMWLLDLELLV